MDRYTIQKSSTVTNTILRHTTRVGRKDTLPTIVACSQSRRLSNKVTNRNSRSLHSTAADHAGIAAIPTTAVPEPLEALRRHNAINNHVSPEAHNPQTPLDRLPASQILRTFLITSISSSPFLLDTSSALLKHMINSEHPLTNVEKNPVLRAILLETFYKQFCAGNHAEQITKMCDVLRAQGYAGVILEYAREVLKDGDSSEAHDIATWRNGIIRSIEMAAPGDFVGLKWSGMGSAALRRMAADDAPSADMADAMHHVCETAAAKNIALLPSAEETSTLSAYHTWSLNMQRQFNRKGKSVVYNTYQAYLRQTPERLTRHLAIAKDEGFTMGVKVVRGAYLATEKKELMQPNIEATHSAYDGIASALIQRSYNETLQPTRPSAMPEINMMLATHNAESVRKAREAREQQARAGKELTTLSFAQLQGMADEVSCSLLASDCASSKNNLVTERVYKLAAWGSMMECLNYLLRRAAENKDAAGRTAETRRAMGQELVRRAFGGLI